jgi:hypothetical protein
MMGRQWPVKILLVNPQAPFMQKGSLTIAADCTLLVNPEISERFGKGETVVIGCPILENPDSLAEKINIIFKNSKVKRVSVYTMEVPCCHAIHVMVNRSIKGRPDVQVEGYIVRVATGKAEPYQPGRIDESMLEMERLAHGH